MEYFVYRYYYAFREAVEIVHGLREADLLDMEDDSTRTLDSDLADLLDLVRANQLTGDGGVDEDDDEAHSSLEGEDETGEERATDGDSDGDKSRDSLENLDWEDEMLFEGDDYGVELHRNVPVAMHTKEFGGGAIRECIYRVRFDQSWRNRSLADIFAQLTALIEGIIERLNRSYAPVDLVRFFISNTAFFSPQCIGLLKLRELTIGKIMAHLEQILQSDRDIFLDEPIELHVAVVRNPRGDGPPRDLTGLFSSVDDPIRAKRSFSYVKKDKLCLARSVVVTLAKHEERRWKKSNNPVEYRRARNRLNNLQERKDNSAQDRAALDLHLRAGFSANDTPTMADIAAFERLTNAQIIVLDSAGGKVHKPLYVGADGREKTLYILYITHPLDQRFPGHFVPILNLDTAFGGTAFCRKCYLSYDKRYNHPGCGQCIVCKSDTCSVVEGEGLSCSLCKRELKSLACYRQHLLNGVCKSTHRCIHCSVFYKPGSFHRCGYRECRVCKTWVTGTHYCYIRHRKPKRVSARYIYADFEADPTGAVHVPNLACAQWECEHCQHETYRQNPRCPHCGTPCGRCPPEVSSKKRGDELRTACLSNPHCGRRGVEFFGDDASKEFCNFIFGRDFRGFCLLFHNGQAYDCYFIAQYVFDHLVKTPKVIYRGSKIVSIDAGNFRIVDTLNFLTFPLAQMPGVFGIRDIRKGYFPVFFNKRENWDYVGPLPDVQYYGVDGMKPKARAEFLTWYETQRDAVFDFRKEILAYCRDDVNILQESCKAFRSWLLGITGREEVLDVAGAGERVTKFVGVDPFQYNTLASVCMATFLYLFLEEKYDVELRDGRRVTGYMRNEVMTRFVDSTGATMDPSDVDPVDKKFVSTPFARMPSGGFAGLDNHSKSSILWLEYEMRRRNIRIQHARNGGEHAIPGDRYMGRLKLDGYHRDDITGKETAWEFMGCIFHGCKRCYPREEEMVQPKHPHTGESLHALYRRTMNRIHHIRHVLGIELHVMWECDFNVMLRSNGDLVTLSEELELLPRLDPRKAFFGGRTNAVKLYRVTEGTMKIGYLDICSLYPTVLKYDVFPVGKPDVIVDPGTTDIHDYFGFVQCRVRPPRRLYHPVLPVRVNGKLMFPLCLKCAVSNRQGTCHCTPRERDLTGEWTTLELLDALEEGYVIQRIHEVYHFRERAVFTPGEDGSALFADYINTFLKGKQEASGWPSSDMTPEEKDDYLSLYERVEGIRLDESNIEFNSGKRATNKLLLNSFWGKFGECNTHRTHKIVRDGVDLIKYMTNPSLELKDVNVISEKCCLLAYDQREGFEPELDHVNVFVAAFTTANARRRLYKVLKGLGTRVLYFDTDSVVYEYSGESGEYVPDIGDHLGQWTNELKEDEYITRFVSSGPKSYAYKTSTERSVVKLKGFTLNYANAQRLNFESIARLVLFWADPDNNTLNEEDKPFVEARYSKICRDKRRFLLFNRDEVKKFRVTYNKRYLIPGTFDTLPFGY